MQRAIGDRLTCVFVDHGLLRKGEAEQVERDFVAATGVDAARRGCAEQRFLDALAGVSDPEEKRKIIGREFIRVFEAAEAATSSATPAAQAEHQVEFLVQGTLYPDVVESGGGAGTANIKTPPQRRRAARRPRSSSWSSRCARCSRTRCAWSASSSACPRRSCGASRSRARASASGSSARSTRERLDILREADAIAREELTRAGLDRDIWQCPVVLLADVRSVGVQGDGRTYGHPVVLRPVTSEDAMTADWARLPYDVLETISTRITNEVREVNRVVLDITSKPPGTIEWE